jgi:hypothetical protein
MYQRRVPGIPRSWDVRRVAGDRGGDPAALANRLEEVGIAPFRPLRGTRFLVYDVETIPLAALVQDPDGCLVLFARRHP